MAKKRKDEEARRPTLQVPREEAARKIGERIEAGRSIQALEIRSEQELDSAYAQRKTWSDYNEELLRSLFDVGSLANEYNAPTAAGYFGYDTWQEGACCFRDNTAEYVRRLKSILGRLDLFADAVPAQTASSGDMPARLSSRNVFVVHGHDEGTREAVCRLLQKLDLNPVVLRELPNEGKTIIEKFEDHAACAYAVVLLTPDDEGHPRDKPEEKRPRARQNVMLELGYFVGKLGRKRVCALHKGNVEIPSDYQGVLYVSLESEDWQLRLAREIKEAGVEADLNRLV